jgi:hypothetical protein
MSAVEGARTQVDDADLHSSAIVAARPGAASGLRQGAITETRQGHAGTVTGVGPRRQFIGGLAGLTRLLANEWAAKGINFNANGTLYYEDDRWSARVSIAHRRRYLTRAPGQETGADADGFDETLNLDASVQYAITKNLKATVEGVNLTNQFENEFNDTQRDLSYYYHSTGREVLFGMRFQY